MTIPALTLMIVSMVTVWGGLALTAVHLIRQSRRGEDNTQ